MRARGEGVFCVVLQWVVSDQLRVVFGVIRLILADGAMLLILLGVALRLAWRWACLGAMVLVMVQLNLLTGVLYS